MFLVKYINSSKFANFGLVDKLLFGPTRNLKFLNMLHKCICSAKKVNSGMI